MIKKSIFVSLAVVLAGFLFSSYRSAPQVILSPSTIMADSSYAEVYPTPFKKEIFIKGFSEEEKEVRVEVFTYSGILVRTFVLENDLSLSAISLDMSGLENEGYVIRVYEENILISKQKVIKNG